jgi:hypothetical protein
MKIALAVLTLCLMAAAGTSQNRGGRSGVQVDTPEAEFHIARVIYRTRGGAGSRGIIQPWWAVDYPLAEEHFLPALRRVTSISVAEDSRHLELSDDRLFQYPLLFMQQPGQGNWRPTPEEAARLREYLLRGGFLVVDDFHGSYDWSVFQRAIQQVMPDRPIVPIPPDDPLMHIFFDVDQSIQIPGARHVRMNRAGQVFARMEGPPGWRGIYDDYGRIMVAMNFNMDMGDAWEHADDPYYPLPMTATAYRVMVNYIIYAMTH